MYRPALAFPVLLFVALAGCSASDATGLGAKACQTQHTANINFTNQSVTNRTYDILVDGSRVTTLAPGQTSSNFVVTAAVQHIIQFNVSNTSTSACTPSLASLIECTTQGYTCRG